MPFVVGQRMTPFVVGQRMIPFVVGYGTIPFVVGYRTILFVVGSNTTTSDSPFSRERLTMVEFCANKALETNAIADTANMILLFMIFLLFFVINLTLLI